MCVVILYFQTASWYVSFITHKLVHLEKKEKEMKLHGDAISEYKLRLDVQCFLWPVNYIALYYVIYTSITACQVAHKKLVLQVAE